MTRPLTRAARKGASAPLLALLCLVLGLLFWSSPASAHDTLISSTPAPGSVHETAPEKAALTFSGKLGQIGATVLLEGPDGKDRELTPEISGSTLTVLLPADAVGRQRLKWRVVSEDGHPIEGVVEYAVGSTASVSPGPSGTSGTTTPAAQASQGATGSQGSSGQSSQTAASQAPASSQDSAGGQPSSRTGMIVLAAIAGGVLAGGLVLFFMLRRSSAE